MQRDSWITALVDTENKLWQLDKVQIKIIFFQLSISYGEKTPYSNILFNIVVFSLQIQKVLMYGLLLYLFMF